MRRMGKAVLVIDDDWQAAEKIRVLIKATGVINIPVVMSEDLVLLAKQFFYVTCVAMPERIKRDSTHHLHQAALRHLPSIPMVAYQEHSDPEPFLRKICSQLGIRSHNTDANDRSRIQCHE